MSGEAADLALIREAHAPQPYNFPTKQTYCPASDVPTDYCHTCIVLARLDVAEARVSRAASLALNCERRAQEDRATASQDGVTIGQAHALRTRAANYDLTADGILRALDVPNVSTEVNA